MAAGSILLVEDSEDDLFFFQKAYARAGMTEELMIARDGADALVQYSAGDSTGDCPLLVLLDLKLPKLGGHDVLAAIRKADPARKTIVICLTGSQEPSDRRRAYEGGANGYLLKPSGMDQVDKLLISIKGFWLDHNVTPRSRLIPRVGEN